jgi:hypothetical protein
MAVGSSSRSFDHPETDIDKKWLEVAKRRLSELSTLLWFGQGYSWI